MPATSQARVKSRVKSVSAKVNGVTYHIPEAWLIAATKKHSRSEAILLWHRQQQLEAILFP